jgi:Zn-dependent protease/CBS domain-containing protein
MDGNIRIGRLLGIPIELNPSWFLIFFLVVWSLGAQVFPTWQPGLPVATYWLMGVAAALVLFGSLLLHEMAHSLMSRHYGLEVRRITLFLFGGVSEAPDEMPSPRAEFWIAIVGPLTSFALALGFFALSWGSGALGAPDALASALGWLGIVNVALALFNMIPGFPLDGGRVLRAAVWARTGDMRKATRWASYTGRAFAVVLMGVGIARLVGGNWFGGLWLGVIGWLLFQAAAGTYAQLKLKEALNQVTVGRLMSRDVVVMDAGLTLQEAVDDYFMALAYGGYPVVDELGQLVGMVTRARVKAVPPGRWGEVRVGEVMVPIAEVPVVRPGEPVGDRLGELMGEGLGRVPVVSDAGLVGVLSQSDVLRYLSWQVQDGGAPGSRMD